MLNNYAFVVNHCAKNNNDAASKYNTSAAYKIELKVFVKSLTSTRKDRVKRSTKRAWISLGKDSCTLRENL